MTILIDFIEIINYNNPIKIYRSIFNLLNYITSGDFTMSKRFLTVRETSQIFFEGKVSVSSLYRLITAGELPAIKIGKKFLINTETLKQKYV